MQIHSELKERRDKIRNLMVQKNIDAALITCNVNMIYTCGRVISGYFYLPVRGNGILFVKRPNNITGEQVVAIRKPEQIPAILQERGVAMPGTLMLEGDELPYTEYCRLAKVFESSTCVNGTPLIRTARAIKTPIEIRMFEKAAAAHIRAYSQIPSVYRDGMTDLEFSIEIERLMRLEGCLGIFPGIRTEHGDIHG